MSDPQINPMSNTVEMLPSYSALQMAKVIAALNAEWREREHAAFRRGLLAAAALCDKKINVERHGMGTRWRNGMLEAAAICDGLARSATEMLMGMGADECKAAIERRAKETEHA